MPKMVTIGWVGAAPHIGEIFPTGDYGLRFAAVDVFFAETNRTQKNRKSAWRRIRVPRSGCCTPR
jgi:hypothetical protein